jgi:hypothetical protein
MPTFVHTANGSKTVFKCLSSALPKFVRVDGKVTAPQSSNANSVTFAVAPQAGLTVEIMYGAIRTVVDLAPGMPPIDTWVKSPPPMSHYDRFPLPTVAVNTAQSIAPPVVIYRDSGAENVVFVLDPEAGEVDVLGDGRITSSRR